MELGKNETRGTSRDASNKGSLAIQSIDYETLSLAYHESHPRGKIGIVLQKPLDTQEQLALAYSPGVAGPCRQIEKDQDASFRYTGRGNLVGVISNGTAVLGLGAIGPYAAKPVMEGKAMLFKKFAGIDSFDLEVAENDPDAFIKIVEALEPTFGGINLEDIKAPECFYIEEKLREKMNIPVFHDDQHGTAIIATAGLLNAVMITDRQVETIRVVFSGGGAAAIACAQMFLSVGVKLENVILVDSKGVVYPGRKDMNPYKERFAQDTHLRTLEDAMVGADVFVGVSAADVLLPEMLSTMASDPIVFALANPNPEIQPALAHSVRPDVIIATGRSDYPNQINNVLCFPYIFRGALDVGAHSINEDMKRAAAYAIADLARQPVPESVQKVYEKEGAIGFGRNYLIPKPIDPRALVVIASAVAEAAMQSGVARKAIDLAAYRDELKFLMLDPVRSVLYKEKDFV
jgi:malate dehydrogenase (oxaloacetate-decarboxylating)(NADP+)